MRSILHALFTPTLGGLEQSYLDMTQALLSRAFVVTALLRPDAPYLQDVQAMGVAVETLAPQGFYDVRAWWQARRLLQRLKPDVILAHNARAIALMKAAAGTVPVIGMSHSYKTARTSKADGLILLTPHMQAHFIAAGYPQERTAMVPNLIHLPAAPPHFERPARVPVIGAIGRFTPEKGFADLLRALHGLMQAGIDFTAIIAGDGEGRAALQQQATALGLQDRLHWPGWIQDKAAFYQSIDMLCVPSLQESFGLVVLEAWAAGVPVVATDAPGPASLITHGGDGLLVPRGDIDAMTDVFRSLVCDPNQRKKMAKSAWKSAQNYNFAAIAKKLEMAIDTLLK